MVYLHSKDIAHRDIKPENIVLDKSFRVKICDFGWACKMERGEVRTSICGTLEYMSPEIAVKNVYTIKTDVWALGILLYEMLHGHPPFIVNNFHQLPSLFST